MTLVNFDVSILKANLLLMESRQGGYSSYTGLVAKDGVEAVLRVTIERADNNTLMAITYSNSDGEFEFNNLAPVKHVLTAQDPAGIKLARATTIMPIVPIIPPDDDGEIGGGIG